MSIDHSSAVGALESDPVFLHVKAGMTVIVTDTDGAWRMAYVIWVDGGARNPKVPTLFQIAEMVLGSSTGSTPTWLPTSAQGSERSGPEALLRDVVNAQISFQPWSWLSPAGR